MPVSTLTSKGQTTIPKPIRDYLRLKAGDKLEFFINDDGNVTMIPRTVDISELEGILPRPEKPVSLSEMEKAIRERCGAK